ncbi:MAG: adenylyltransferase/cytidyltransferase family protein, partial [Flavobacteriaceae bacterium]
MKVISNIDNYHALEGCSLTIGTFDGVHVGHRKIIERLVKSAKEKNHLSVVLTFFPHPRMVLQKDTRIRLIDTLEEKQQLLKALGVDILVIHPFSKVFSRQSADEFIRDILVNA